ncbi:hypothetical protein C7212DRAFT_280692 [Tuber magnatum]|uniref:Uncharacterized protein n=1 Tax=Tuber magnatum TaxID=42249 RepID=A0A317SPI7_9PEZI|nr:hypothetical protein C7212DRAFT_280692 [Tuber magnatum]
MHFSTSLYLFSFLTLGAAFQEGVSAGRNHQRFHRRYGPVDGIVPAGVTPPSVEPAVVEPATVEGPPNNAVVDISQPPTGTGAAGIQTLVPTTLATAVKDSTLPASLSAPPPTSETCVVPTNGDAHELPSGHGVAPTTTSATGETVVSSTPPAIATSSVVTTKSTTGSVATSTKGRSISNYSSTSSLKPPATIDAPSTGSNATTASFTLIASSDSITSTLITTNTTTASSSTSKGFVTTTSTSTPRTVLSGSAKTSSGYSKPPPSTTTYRLTLATPSTPAVASQSRGLDMAEFNKTKPCFDKKCEDPESEMTYNKTVTFNVDNGDEGGVRLGRGPDVASVATRRRGEGPLRLGMAAAVVGISVVLAVL